MANINMKLPNITDNNLDSAKERKEIKDYLFQLTEQLRYVLNNIDEENLSDEIKVALEDAKNTPDILQKEIKKVTEQGVKLGSRITQTAEVIQAEVTRASEVEGNLSSSITQTAESIQTEVNRATAVEGNLSSSISQTAESISSKVDKNGIISAINQTAEIIQILASKIKLEGYTTINGNFAIDEFGNVKMTGSGFEITFDDYGMKVKDVVNNVVTTEIQINGIATDFFMGSGLSLSGGINSISLNGSNLYNWLSAVDHGHSSYDITPQLTADLNIDFPGSINGASVTYCQATFVRLDGSDLRLKQDIVSVDDSIDNFYFNLKPKKYKFKPINDGSSVSPPNDEQIHFGLIAQEVKSNIVNNGLQDDFAIIQTRPVTKYSNEGLYVDDEVMRVEYKELITLTIYEVQKMNDKIKQQETRISNLETELTTIKEILARNNIV